MVKGLFLTRGHLVLSTSDSRNSPQNMSTLFKSPSHQHGATRPISWSASASRFLELYSEYSEWVARTHHVFPHSWGVGSPIVRCHTQPALHSPLIAAAKCYSSGRRDDSGRREIGEDLKGPLCSTAQADESVYEIARVYKTEAPCTRRVPQFGVSGGFSLCGDMQNQ
jgi:hypothetical protein